MTRLLKPWLRSACGIAMIALCQDAAAQENNPLIDSKSLIAQGIARYDKGDYKQAAALYQQVPEGDTNYAQAANELMLTYLSDSSYQEAILLSRKMLALPVQPYHRSSLLFLGHAYDYSGRTDSALACYDRLIAINPYDHQPYYEKGATYLRAKQYDKAEACFRQSLQLNPYHYRSHYALGSVMLLEGRLTEAYLALSTSLFTTGDIKTASPSIALLAAISNQTEEAATGYRNRDKEKIPAAYEDIDQIINARLPLSKEYSFKSVLAGDKIINTLHAIMEKLQYQANEPSLVMQYYVPLYTKVYESEKFDPFILLMFAGYNIEAVDKYARKKKGDIDEMRTEVFSYLDRIAATQTLNYNERKAAPIRYVYLKDSRAFLTGPVKTIEPLAFGAGPVRMYREGVISAEGSYDANGKKTGTWRYYEPSGLLKSEEHYADGEYTGKNTFYHANGNIREAYLFDDNHKQLEERDYDYNGTFTALSKTRGADERHIVTYHPNGREEFAGDVVKGKLKDGHYRYYFDNGTVSKELDILNGKTNGVLREFYRDGQVSEESHYREGKLEGAYTSYHKNGAVYYKATYKNGDLEGIMEEFDEAGKRLDRTDMQLGKRHGTDSLFTPEGRSYGVIHYKRGFPEAASYTDEAGKPLSDGEGKTTGKVIFYYPNGNKSSEINYRNGQPDGLATYYYPAGMRRRTAYFKEGQLDGLATEYHMNGKPNSEIAMKNDAQDGYIKVYYESGRLRMEGWVKADKRQGTWRSYNAAGKLENQCYYLDSKLQGPSVFYYANGKPNYCDIYDRDMLIGLIEYNQEGNEQSRTYYPQGNGLYRLIHANGHPSFTATLVHGDYNGPYIKQTPDGTVLEKGYFRFGKRDSVCETFSPVGRLIVKSNYRDGKRQGPLTVYNEDGSLLREKNFSEGELTGRDKIWQHGLLTYESNYKEDKRHGDQIIYGDDKKPVCVLTFQAGTLTGYSLAGNDGNMQPVTKVKNGTCAIAAFYPNGSKALVYQYKDNQLTGRQQLYYSNGQLAEERTYAGGNLNGPVRKWLPDGKPCYDATYTDDEYEGKELTYDSKGNLVASLSFIEGGIQHGPSVYTDPKTKKSVTVNYYYGTVTDRK